MTDELPTDDLPVRAKLGVALLYVVELVRREAKGLVETVATEEGAGDAATRRLTSLVIALGRITEMDDRYNEKSARARTPEERVAIERAVEREIRRLMQLSPDDIRAELESGVLRRAQAEGAR